MKNIERQIQLEADAVQEGVLRFFKGRRFQLATDFKPTRDIVANSLEPFAERIVGEQSVIRYSQSGKPAKYCIPMLSLPGDKLALITVGTILNSISKAALDDGLGAPVTALAHEIGQRCRLERLYDLFRKRGVDMAAELGSRNRSRNARRRADELARKLDDEYEWAKHYIAHHLGEKLISLAERFVTFHGKPIFELKNVREKHGGQTKTTQRIMFTAAAGEWMAAYEKEMASLVSPFHLPMVVQPRPWTSLSSGGYLVTPLNLLKRHAGPQAKQKHETACSSLVLSAVNAVQSTPFRMNKAVHRVMRPSWDAGHTIFGQRKWQNDAKSSCRSESLKNLMELRLAMAEKFLDEPEIYYPHQLDYRGRAYPVPQLINPQSDQIARSLLEFAEGKPLGENGAHWLAIHLVNCYWKKGKVSFAERLNWLHRNEREIIAFAENPAPDHRFWDEADKPWMFLAACFEWRGYREQGPRYVSHLPISMDGSCNAYQHLSAMGRDPAGGALTNLVPGDEPRDMYQQVADLVSEWIARDAQRPGPNQDAAIELLGKIDRKAVKNATMTTPYGVTRWTIYLDLLDSEPVIHCKKPEQCAQYLAELLTKCIPQVAVNAGRIMEWLRQIARILAKKNRGMAWTTLSGFRVEHETREPKPIRLSTFDRSIVLYIEDATRKIAVRKQADGIVPHLVHSMDASHMVLTVNRLHAEGIRHFVIVHDSFGVHAADIDLLNRVLREEFVRIYSEPVLENFIAELRKANPDIVLPDPPPTGDLDIRQVLASPYFFA